MFRSSIAAALVLSCAIFPVASAERQQGQREFPASDGGTLILELDTGASVKIVGTGGSSVVVDYAMDCSPACAVEFDETSNGVRIRTDFAEHGNKQRADMDLTIQVPSRFDVELESMGGAISIDGVEGNFEGRTMGGEITLHDVRGTAELKTMGGGIRLTDSELDGSLETMGGKVVFENVVGDVRGSSMGGDVRYINVQRRSGGMASPARNGAGLDGVTSETVQISTMGGDIDVENAIEGADVHTMGGDIDVDSARGFVRAKTLGGDIKIGEVDGWVKATTMGGDVDVMLIGDGGEVDLTSMGGDVTLIVPAGFGMDIDIELAFTRKARGTFTIDAPGSLQETVTDEWEESHGSARKYRRMSGAVNGGGNAVTIRTVNGDIRIREQ